MRRKLPIFAVLLLGTLKLEAHTIRPPRVEIQGVGKTATFVVADQGNCSAAITATSADPSTATVSPDNANAVAQTFTVTGHKGGSTYIVITWRASGGQCNDAGSANVNVTVISGPDLTISQAFLSAREQQSFGYDDDGNIDRVRVGQRIALDFVIGNEGPETATGDATITDLIHTGFEVKGMSEEECSMEDRTANCFVRMRFDGRASLPPGEFMKGPLIILDVKEAGQLTNVANIIFGPDIDTSDNHTRTAVLESLPPRSAARAADVAPVNTNGRR